VPGVSFVQFGDADVVRHPLVGHIVRAYDKHDAARQEAARHEVDRQGGRSADGYRR
jgi:phosphate starvation-inducible PhoH-like protein